MLHFIIVNCYLSGCDLLDIKFVKIFRQGLPRSSGFILRGLDWGIIPFQTYGSFEPVAHGLPHLMSSMTGRISNSFH